MLIFFPSYENQGSLPDQVGVGMTLVLTLSFFKYRTVLFILFYEIKGQVTFRFPSLHNYYFNYLQLQAPVFKGSFKTTLQKLPASRPEFTDVKVILHTPHGARGFRVRSSKGPIQYCLPDRRKPLASLRIKPARQSLGPRPPTSIAHFIDWKIHLTDGIETDIKFCFISENSSILFLICYWLQEAANVLKLFIKKIEEKNSMYV